MLYWGQSVQNLQCFQPFPTPIICRPLPGRRTFDRSIFNPSISQRYRCGVNRRTSFSFCGRWYAPVPAAYSLYSRMHPSRSLQNSLMQSSRLPQSRNSVLVNGSGLNRAAPWPPPHRFLSADPYSCRRDIYLVCSGEVTQHDFSTWQIVHTAAVSAPE